MLNFYKLYFKFKLAHRIILILLLIDFVFIFIDIGSHYIVFTNPNIKPIDYASFYVTSDSGYAEIFQYIKYLLIIFSIILIIVKKKELHYISWMVLFTILLLDDALLFHERSAMFLAKYFKVKPIMGINLQSMGELVYSAIIGSILLFGIAISYYLGNKKFKNTCIDIMFLFILFLVFGIGVDLLHGIFNDNQYVRYTLGVLEDGGEMMVLSIISWYFTLIIIRPSNYQHYLYEYFDRASILIKNILRIK